MQTLHHLFQKSATYLSQDELHHQVLRLLDEGREAETAIYDRNPPHLNEFIRYQAERGRQSTFSRVRDALHLTPPSYATYKPHRRFSISMVLALTLWSTFWSDIIWVIFTAQGYNINLEQTDNFWEQTLAQQLYNFLTAMFFFPFGMLAAAHIYGKDYRSTAMVAFITAIASVGTVIPFNLFQSYGIQLGAMLGLDATAQRYFAAFLPGPGTSEGILQTMLIVLGNKLLNKNYIFDKREFGIAISPLSWAAGDMWQLFFELTQGLPVEARAIIVALADFAALVLSTNAIEAVVNAIKEKYLRAISEHPEVFVHQVEGVSQHRQPADVLHANAETNEVGLPENFRDFIHTIRRSGSPIHTAQALPAQSSIGHMVESAKYFANSAVNYMTSFIRRG